MDESEHAWREALEGPLGGEVVGDAGMVSLLPEVTQAKGQVGETVQKMQGHEKWESP